MKYALAAVGFLLSNCLAAQTGNLILNPSFELKNPKIELFYPGKDYPSCTWGNEPLHFNAAVQDWSSFTESTPDLIVWAPDAKGQECHFPKPQSGDRAVGILTYLPAIDMGRSIDFHEFIQGRLSKPLVKGKEYTFAFYIQWGKASGERHIRNLNKSVKSLEVIPLAAGSLGVWFTDFEEKNMTLDVAFPQLVWYDPIVTQPGEWLLMSKTFTADKAYTHFTIGNFTTDANTATNLPNSTEIDEFNNLNKSWQVKKRRVGYYLLDDFWLGEGTPPAPPVSIAEVLKKNNAYTFRNVNFQAGKWDLLPEAMPELNGLVDFMTTNKGAKVEIGGHTDSVGETETNRILSEKRASSVANYLISKGINAERVSAKGYGEGKPIGSNETENGRLMNRRVECKVL